MSWNKPLCIENLLDIRSLSMPAVERILSKASEFLRTAREGKAFPPLLAGKTIVTFFMEPSTRTHTSFELAARRLGGLVVNIQPSLSSLKKGETLGDTIRTFKAMDSDFIVMRHQMAGAPYSLIHEGLKGIINAGDGMHAHPSQALLDALTLRQHLGTLEGKTIGICGDIKHSRVARSDILLLTALGARIRLIAPSSLVSPFLESEAVTHTTDMEAALPELDGLIMLRLQNERLKANLLPSQKEFFRFYGLDERKYALLKKEACILHPGPVNKYVEIEPTIMAKKNCLIEQQIHNGVAIRMAIFDMLGGRHENL